MAREGRLYDPHLSRFLTPDPIVAHPGFGQSWNPYSYVLNGPLSHVDPTGFTEEPADAVVSPAGFLIIPGPSDEPYVDMVWQVIAVGTESEEPSEAPDSGAAVLPQNANTWGNNAGWLPQPSATAQELPRQNSIGLEIYIGVTQGTVELALDAAKSLLLNALTFGGYGTWQLGKAIWAGYQEDEIPGALNAVNPLYQLARGGADTYMAAERGNYRAAGAAGVKTVVLGTAAVVGVARGVGALAAKGAAARSSTTGLTARPRSFQKSTVQAAWDSAADGPNGGKLCPTCDREAEASPHMTAKISRKTRWSATMRLNATMSCSSQSSRMVGIA